jgi:hypothetical protein
MYIGESTCGLARREGGGRMNEAGQGMARHGPARRGTA